MLSFLNEQEKILIIIGSKGIGKSTSLIKFSFISKLRIFYFNIEVFEKNKYEGNQKIEMKIQLTKILGNYVKCYKEGVKKEIDDYINN